MEEQRSQKTLYERLGGVYHISAIVDHLLEKRAEIARQKLGDQDDGHAAARRPGLKYLVTEMLCDLAGGPQTYSGLSMVDSHVDLVITKEDWGVFMDDLRSSLEEFEVPTTDQRELFHLVETTRSDIITRP